MEEKLDEQYNKYLTEKLDSIFNSQNGKKYNNPLNTVVKEIDKHIDEPERYIDKDLKCYFVDRDGHTIETKYEYAGRFHEGYAMVRNEYFYACWNFIDRYGNRISDTWFEKVQNFHNGYAKVCIGRRWNWLKGNGKLVSDNWFDEIRNFHEGYAMVRDGKKWDFVDTNGKPINIRSYDEVGDFYEGYARVKKDNYWYFINNSGSYLSEIGYDEVGDFHEGYAWIRRRSKLNYIDKNGRPLFDKQLDFDVVYDFHNGYARVIKDGKQNFIDKSGKLLLKENVDYAWDFNDGYAKIRKNKKESFIDLSGIEILPYQKYSSDFIRSSLNFLLLDKDKKIIPKLVEMDNYQIIKQVSGYKCINSYDQYKLKYKPLKRYGFRYTICIKDNRIYMFDRITKKYNYLGDLVDFIDDVNVSTIVNISYDDNFVVNRKNKRVYFMYENQMIDISDYYREKLIDKLEINVKSGAGSILSKEEFSFLNINEIEKLMQEEKDRLRKEKEKQEELERKIEQEQQKKRINDEKDALNQRRLLEEERIQKEKLESLKKIQIELEKLRKIGVVDIPIKKEKIDNIFIDKDGHREIDPDYIDILMFIDLKDVDFSNVKVCNIDFRGTNIEIGSYHFNPQTVYQKDMSNCNFEGIYIGSNLLISFEGVDIRGSKFSDDDNPKTLDQMNLFFGAIYDDSTTYNGVSILELLRKNNSKK